MCEIHSFSGMLEFLKNRKKAKRIAVVCPYDEETLESIKKAIEEKIITAILIGESARITQALDLAGLSADTFTIVDTPDPHSAAATAVSIINTGGADILMKGLVNTDVLLKAVLNKENGLLPAGNILTHLTVVDVPSYHKLLFVSDVAVIPYPTLSQREAMIKYDVEVCHKFGIDHPNVALIHFNEKVNPKFPNSVDYQSLVEMGAKGMFGDAVIAGPMDVKTACDTHSAGIKGLTSSVCGNADILIFPNIDAGNTFYKTVTFFAHGEVAGILQGAKCPVVLSSRSDSAASKFYSLALGCMSSLS